MTFTKLKDGMEMFLAVGDLSEEHNNLKKIVVRDTTGWCL